MATAQSLYNAVHGTMAMDFLNNRQTWRCTIKPDLGQIEKVPLDKIANYSITLACYVMKLAPQNLSCFGYNVLKPDEIWSSNTEVIQDEK